MQNQITKAIFPIAGLGTRFLPATKSVPKEMITILDRPVIEWAVIEAANAGIKEMIFVTSSRKNIILEHFEKSELLELTLKKKNKNKTLNLISSQNQLGKFTLVIQDEPKGLGHAINCTNKLFSKEENFAVILPDDVILSKTPAIKQLMIAHKKKNGGSVIGLEKVPIQKISNYGVVEFKNKSSGIYSITGLVEKPKKKDAPSNLSVVGRYILNSKVFNYLKLGRKGTGNEIQLTDSLNLLIDSPGLYGVEFEGKRFDCGNKLGFIEANLNFGLKDKEIKNNLKRILKKI